METKVSSPYPITPIAYYRRFIKNVDRHNETQDKSFLIYAALKLRFSIESLLFYYLHSLNRGELSKSQQKLYRPHDLKKAILATDPLFLAKLEFADMCAHFNNMISSKLKPDVDLLASVHGKLGDWLHAEYSPLGNKIPEKAWVEIGELFDSVGSHLSLILSYPLLEVNLTEEGEQLMSEFLSGGITRETVTEKMNKMWNRFFRGVTQHIVLDQ